MDCATSPTAMLLTLPVACNSSYRRADAEDAKGKFLSPSEAVGWAEEIQKGGKCLTEIKLHGPGDVLNSWPQTMECVRLLNAKFTEIPLSMTTLGVGGLDKVDDIAHAGLSKLTLRVDAVNRETAKTIYSWIRPGKKTIPLDEGCGLLLEEQPAFCKACAEKGIDVVIRTKVEAANVGEVEQIASLFSAAGAGSIELCGQVSTEVEDAVRKYLPVTQMKPEPIIPPPGSPGECIGNSAKHTEERPNVAVASYSGMDVDIHLGQARKLLIYGKDKDGLVSLLESREVPPAGTPERWQSLAENLGDCFCLLATHAGQTPREELAAKGLQVILTDDQISGLVDTLFGGGKKGKCKQ